ncbi:hypothetical protein [Promicromonospora sp. NPDC050880]|uniref:hypothetical protein n=1 Tax=Promicromonospora sp. NPDC050880 TaxID=3364406 RepID=UPI0037BD57A4
MTTPMPRRIPAGLAPLAADLHALGMAVNREQWEKAAERLAEHWAPLMFRAIVELGELHQCSEPPHQICTRCTDANGTPEPWPCATLCAVSEAMSPEPGTEPGTIEFEVDPGTWAPIGGHLLVSEAPEPPSATVVTARVEVDNLTRDEAIAALDAVPVGASLWIERKHVVLGGKRFDVNATELTPHAARDYAAALTDHMDAVAHSVDGPRPHVTAQELDAWPFKPGDVVRDSGEDADHGAWLDAAPDGVVVADEKGSKFQQTPNGWFNTEITAVSLVRGALTGHELEREHGPLTVVSLPDVQEACTDEAPAGDA